MTRNFSSTDRAFSSSLSAKSQDLILITKIVFPSAPRAVKDRSPNFQPALLVQICDVTLIVAYREFRGLARDSARRTIFVLQVERALPFLYQVGRLVIEQEEGDEATATLLEHAPNLAEIVLHLFG